MMLDQSVEGLARHVVDAQGFEPRYPKATDLQSAAVSYAARHPAARSIHVIGAGCTSSSKKKLVGTNPQKLATKALYAK